MIEDSAYRAEKIDCKFWFSIFVPVLFVERVCLVWDDVYGFNMSAIKPSAILEPLVRCRFHYAIFRLKQQILGRCC